MNELTIISRKSSLAKLQAIEVSEVIKKKYPEIKIIFKTKDTSGDIDLTTPLHKMPEMGVFTSDIREELLTGKADIAIHSWKDLPVDLEEGTEIAATIKRADPRDVLIFKKSSFKKKKLEIYTSSPRRQENLSKFLKKAFPFEINSFSFSDIRGNILTRVQKLKDSNADGLVIAKAALDRLLSPIKEITTELDSFKKDLDEFLWMVIPCSQNPCAPGQGALAVEIKSGNKEVIELLNEINDSDVFKDVEEERKKLKKYGGGCHQKIGVSIENHPLGKITTEKGLTPENELIDKRFFSPFKKELSRFKNPIEDFYPKSKKDFKLFSRSKIDEGIKEMEAIKNSGLYISRASSIEKVRAIDLSNVIWTSGIENWFKLARKGIWVNGTSDSLGEEQSQPSSLLEEVNWFLVSHTDSESKDKKLIATYKLVPEKETEDLSKYSHFYWMSISSFKEALKKFPSIENAEHSCGLGKTFDELNKLYPNKIKPFLNYEDWLEKVNEAK